MFKRKSHFPETATIDGSGVVSKSFPLWRIPISGLQARDLGHNRAHLIVYCGFWSWLDISHGRSLANRAGHGVSFGKTADMDSPVAQ
jgi:hypothetical protein